MFENYSINYEIYLTYQEKRIMKIKRKKRMTYQLNSLRLEMIQLMQVIEIKGELGAVLMQQIKVVTVVIQVSQFTWEVLELTTINALLELTT